MHVPKAATNSGRMPVSLPRQILLFTAAGNGNWGDNMQPLSWYSHICQRWRCGVQVQLTSSTAFNRSAEYDYPFPAKKHIVDEKCASGHSLCKWPGDVLWIGGGGLLAWPHLPLAHNKHNWQRRVPQSVVLAAVGVCCNAGANAAAAPLLRRAVYASGRHEPDVDLLKALGAPAPFLMPDPILCDAINYPAPPINYSLPRTAQHAVQQLPTARRPKRVERRTCWIFSYAETVQHLQHVRDRLLQPQDTLIDMEVENRRYHGVFGSREVETHHTGTELFSKLVHECDVVVSNRYHGVVLALRAILPVVGITYDPRRSRKVENLLAMFGESRCVCDSNVYSADFGRCLLERLHACPRLLNVTSRLARLHEVEQTFDHALLVAMDKQQEHKALRPQPRLPHQHVPHTHARGLPHPSHGVAGSASSRAATR